MWSIANLPESPQATVKALCVCPSGICNRDKLPSFLWGQEAWKQFVSCNLLFPHFLGNLFEDLKLSLANNLSWQYYLGWKWVPHHRDLQKNQSPDMSGDVFSVTTPTLCVLKQVKELLHMFSKSVGRKILSWFVFKSRRKWEICHWYTVLKHKEKASWL